MSTVTISDIHDVAVTAIPISPDAKSALVKYAQSPELSLKLLSDVTGFSLPLVKAAATPVSLGLQLGKSFDFGAGQPQFSVSAGPAIAIHVNTKKDSPLFSDDFYQSEVTVKEGEGYVSAAVTGSVKIGVSESAADITTGFSAGDSVTFEYIRRFDVDASSPLLGEAVGDVFSGFVILAGVSDLAQLRPGDLASCTGKRSIKVSGAFAARVSAVPLASPALPLVGTPVQLNAGASLDVVASYKITSSWQIRCRAVSAEVVELGIYRAAGSDWDFSVAASAGVDVSLGSKDLLTKLIDKLSKDPAADQKELSAATLGPDQIAAINSAIAASLDRSIHASLSLDLKGLDNKEAAFLYNIELNKLTPETAAAVTAVLHGDLSVIQNSQGAPGITLVRDILTRTKENGATVKINLIGLFNFLSLTDFISKSQVVHEPVSGDVVFSETASGQRIGVLSLPQEQEKLRKLIFDSVLMTTTYRGAGALETMGMECSAVHFALHSTTNEHTLSDYLDWFVALRLLNAGEKDGIMSSFRGTGASTCTARVAFNDQACKAMFLFDGAPRTNGEYVALGREALQVLLLPPPGDQIDADAYRREVLSRDAVWSQFEGQTTIGPVMVRTKNWQSNDPRIPVLASDYTVIMWWADAMSSTARKIADMQEFLRTADAGTLGASQTFQAKRADVQKHVLGVIKNSPMSFSQPFGLVALASAAGPAAVASGVLLSPAFSRQFGARGAAGAA